MAGSPPRAAPPDRTGLQVGEASVAIVARAPHRGDAFAACRYAIERVKQIAPIWKREFFEGGDVWIEGATADPDDERARAEAERVACAVTVRLFARLRDIAGADELTREVAPGATIRRAVEAAGAGIPGAGPVANDRSRARSTPITRGWTPRFATATKSRFCRRFRAADDQAAGAGGEELTCSTNWHRKKLATRT